MPKFQCRFVSINRPETSTERLGETVLILLARVDQELIPGCDDLRRVRSNVTLCVKPQNVCKDRCSPGWDSKQIPPEEVRRRTGGLYLPWIILLCLNLTAMMQGLSWNVDNYWLDEKNFRFPKTVCLGMLFGWDWGRCMCYWVLYTRYCGFCDSLSIFGLGCCVCNWVLYSWYLCSADCTIASRSFLKRSVTYLVVNWYQNTVWPTNCSQKLKCL